MSIKDDVALLKAIPLFSRVDDAQLNVLAFAMERIVLEDGDLLFRDGEQGNAAFVVVSGEIELTRNAGAGEVMVTLQKGALVGEQSMFAAVPYRGTARAQGTAELVKISRDLFYKVAEEFPDLARAAIKSVNDKLDSTLSDLRSAQRGL